MRAGFPWPAPLRGAAGRLLLGAWVALASGCPEVVDPGPAPSDVVADDGGDAGGAMYTACDPGAAVTACLEGWFCHAGAGVCLACEEAYASCTDAGGLDQCRAPVFDADGAVVDGGLFEEVACADGQACHEEAGVMAACADIICEPGYSTCADDRVRRCVGFGTEIVEEACPEGQLCYEAVCGWPRHDVILLFDTSSSMWRCVAGQESACGESGVLLSEAWPQCDDLDAPAALFTIAKLAFQSSLKAAVLEGQARFALQRFPQQEATDLVAPGCWLGFYEQPLQTGGQVLMTDDDGSHDTSTSPTDWFLQHRRQVIPIGFPVHNGISNTELLVSWFDFSETIYDTGVDCEVGDEVCPGQCRQTSDGDHRCFEHANPELRAAGATPLGKSLFYAGEYYRRAVFVDGMPCAKSADCGSGGYFCTEGACRDPFAGCRDHMVVVFTDGEENVTPGAAEFFSPVNQARRLAGTISCTADADCPTGPLCATPSDCVERPPCIAGLCPDGESCDTDLDCVRVHSCSTKGWCTGGAARCQAIEGESYWGTCTGDAWANSYQPPGDHPLRVGLSGWDGTPHQIATYVVAVTSFGDVVLDDHAQIAWAGRGDAYPVEGTDAAGLQEALLTLMTPKFKCQ